MSDELNIGGMTVNERLNHFGLLGEFAAAIKARDKTAATAVLARAPFAPAQAEYTASRVLGAPAKYGY